jgi:DNA-binding transcriptional regulator YiaG
MELKQKIKTLREEILKETQEAFARRIPTNGRTISGWENGRTPQLLATKKLDALFKRYGKELDHIEFFEKAMKDEEDERG